jgi:hypothetical protein
VLMPDISVSSLPFISATMFIAQTLASELAE